VVDASNPAYDTFVLWDAGPRGKLWVLYRRDDAYLRARFSGWDIRADLDASLREQIDLEALLSTFACTDFFGLTTTPEFADQPVP
jgi:hypothetical protein